MKIVKSSLIIISLALSGLHAGDTIATVNGKNITADDAELFVKASAPQASFIALPSEQKVMIIDRLIERSLFIEAAKKDKVDESPLFKENLEKLKDELFVNLWMKKQMEHTIVSDSEAKDFYKKNQDKFKNPQTAQAKHILVKTEKEAKDIIAQMSKLTDKALMDKFVELAKSKSTGPSGPNGGDLGSFTADQMVSEFSKATFALKEGTITMTPVKTQFGFHIIYLEKINPAEIIAFDKVKDNIIQSLRQKQFNSKLTEIAKELRSKADVKNLLDTNSSK